MEVVVSSVSVVRPSTPTPQPCTWLLSNLDLLASTYARNVYYYQQLPAEAPFDVFVECLKRSLSELLVSFYPFAGTVQLGNDGRYFVNCNDSGVPFHQATTDQRLDKWRPLEEQLNAQEDFVTEDGKIAAPLQIQVTRFACGSIALGWAVAETLVDGHSAFELMKSWAEVHRGLKPSNPPIFNLGELLQPREPLSLSCQVERDYIAVKARQGWASVNYKRNSSNSEDLYDRRLFTITQAQVTALIQEIQEGPYGYGKPSSFEAMAGLVWKSMTEARELEDSAITKYLFALSFRSCTQRWEPVISAASFGNAVHIACLPALAGDIKSKHVSYAASLIHQDIQALSMEDIKSSIDWMQMQMDAGQQVGFNSDMYAGTDVHCTSLYTFPIYDVDFGYGKPLHYSLVVDPWFGDGVAFMLPTRDGGRNRVISMAMPPSHMKRLLQSDLFLTFTSEKQLDSLEQGLH